MRRSASRVVCRQQLRCGVYSYSTAIIVIGNNTISRVRPSDDVEVLVEVKCDGRGRLWYQCTCYIVIGYIAAAAVAATGTDERVRLRVRSAALTGLPVGNRIRRRGAREWYRRDETAAIYAIAAAAAAASGARRRRKRAIDAASARGQTRGSIRELSAYWTVGGDPMGGSRPRHGSMDGWKALAHLINSRPTPHRTRPTIYIVKNGDIVLGVWWNDIILWLMYLRRAYTLADLGIRVYVYIII